MTVTCLYDHLSCRSYEYGSRAGFWRLHREFTKRHMPVTVYAVAKALELNPAAGKVGGMWQDLTRHVRQRVTLDSVPDARCTCATTTPQAMVEAGWEVASHGYRWIDYQNMPEEEEREHIRKVSAACPRHCLSVACLSRERWCRRCEPCAGRRDPHGCHGLPASGAVPGQA